MCGLFIFIPRSVTAAINVNVKQMEHKTVPTNKVWKIKFSQEILEDKLIDKVVVYKPVGSKVLGTKISYDPINKTVQDPPAAGYVPGQTYSLHIYDTMKDLNNNSLNEPVIMNFTIEVKGNGGLSSNNWELNYKEYDKTLVQIVDMQSKVNPVNVLTNFDLYPSKLDISAYLDPKNFVNYEYSLYQFLELDSYIEGITAEDLNIYLKSNGGNGVLENQGEAFIAAAKANNINLAYLVAHTLLETGHGTSNLSIGYEISEVGGIPFTPPVKTFNMFGIGATDINPLKNGSEYAYNNDWLSVESAIMGGAKHISDEYINNFERKQNTLYKMRWNPGVPLAETYLHQYATDIGWSYKISCIVKSIQDLAKDANLVFEIPKYK